MLPRTLIATVKEELLADTPSIEHLLETLARECDTDLSSASLLLVNIVRELNAQLFPAIQKLELMLTYNCNLRCAYCFEHGLHKSGSMTAATAYKAIDLLFDYAGDNEDLYITHFGGEPTLNFPVMQKATVYAEQQAELYGKKVHFNTTTNGVNVSDLQLDFFAEHQVKVLFSVDGMRLSHNRFRIDSRGAGTFDRVIETIQRMRKRVPWIGVKMTVTRENIGNMVEDVIGLYDLGINQFLLGPATSNMWQEEDIQLYFRQLELLRQWYRDKQPENIRISEIEDKPSEETYFGCQACRNSLSVDVEGMVTGCSKIRSLEKDFLVGKLGDVNYGLTHLKQRYDFISCTALKENCSRLGIQDNYFGGCFASNYEQNNDLFIPNIFDHDISLRTRQMFSS